VVKDERDRRENPTTNRPRTVVTTTNPPAGQKAGNDKKEFYFRPVRVEDPNLVQELEEAKVSFMERGKDFFHNSPGLDFAHRNDDPDV